MSLKKYEAFAKTVELGSLTKAADALGYTQSSMSHMLSSLEEELGFSILLRGRSGIRLTAAGEELLPKIKELLALQQQIRDLAASIADDSRGIVRVGAFTSVAVNWLPGILKEFRKTHPDVQIQMLSGDYHDMEQWLRSGQVDVSFVALPAMEGVSFIPLQEDPLMVILPEDHPLTAYDRIPVELAAKEPIISLLETSSQDIVRALGTSSGKPDVRYVTKDDYAIIAMVRAGLGVSIMPQLLLSRVASDIAVRPLEPGASRTIAMAFSPSRKSIPAVESFMRCVEKWVAENTQKDNT